MIVLNSPEKAESSSGPAAEKDKDQDIDLLEVYDYIMEKCEYGSAPEKLNEHERAFMVAESFLIEFDDGGFISFFDNPSGDFANETYDAFVKIGLPEIAKIYEKATTIFDGPIPKNCEDRRELIDKIDIDEKLIEECEKAFREHSENLEDAYIAYIKAHRSSFEI